MEIANRITAVVTDEGVAARLADDTFAVLFSLITNKNAIAPLVQELQQRLAAPIHLGDHEVTVGANVGVVIVDHSYYQAEHVLRDGSLALLQARQNPQKWRVFQPEMHKQALHRLTLEGKLRQALRQQQLQIFYQPIVAMTSVPATAPIVGYEALVRWQPEGTSDFLSPADFIPLAEESDLISQLGNWVFRAVCEQLQQWQHVAPTRPVPFVSVNFSVRHLQGEHFAQQIYTVLQQTQVEPAWLKFEITESLLLGDTEPMLETLAQLRHWGIQISIDDFGAGYSSISYLYEYEFDVVKLDKKFAKALENSEKEVSVLKRDEAGNVETTLKFKVHVAQLNTTAKDYY